MKESTVLSKDYYRKQAKKEKNKKEWFDRINSGFMENDQTDTLL